MSKKSNYWKRGEIVTLLTIGVMVVVGVSVFVSSLFVNRDVRKTGVSAVEGCSQYPSEPTTPNPHATTTSPGYYWQGDCANTQFLKPEFRARGYCVSNDDCIQNTSQGEVFAGSSNWCYGFSGGSRCMQLKYGINPSGQQQPTPTQGAQNMEQCREDVVVYYDRTDPQHKVCVVASQNPANKGCGLRSTGRPNDPPRNCTYMGNDQRYRLGNLWYNKFDCGNDSGYDQLGALNYLNAQCVQYWNQNGAGLWQYTSGLGSPPTTPPPQATTVPAPTTVIPTSRPQPTSSPQSTPGAAGGSTCGTCIPTPGMIWVGPKDGPGTCVPHGTGIDKCPANAQYKGSELHFYTCTNSTAISSTTGKTRVQSDIDLTNSCKGTSVPNTIYAGCETGAQIGNCVLSSGTWYQCRSPGLGTKDESNLCGTKICGDQRSGEKETYLGRCYVCAAYHNAALLSNSPCSATIPSQNTCEPTNACVTKLYNTQTKNQTCTTFNQNSSPATGTCSGEKICCTIPGAAATTAPVGAINSCNFNSVDSNNNVVSEAKSCPGFIDESCRNQSDQVGTRHKYLKCGATNGSNCTISACKNAEDVIAGSNTPHGDCNNANSCLTQSDLDKAMASIKNNVNISVKATMELTNTNDLGCNVRYVDSIYLEDKAGHLLGSLRIGTEKKKRDVTEEVKAEFTKYPGRDIEVIASVAYTRSDNIFDSKWIKSTSFDNKILGTHSVTVNSLNPSSGGKQIVVHLKCP